MNKGCCEKEIKKMDGSRLVFGNTKKCEKPILSIVIPTYRSTKFLFQALDSAINQTKYIEYEIVVVSNDPENSLSVIIDKYKKIENLFIYQNSENIGMVGNANRCAELARGEYIAFLHDDDYLLNNYMRVVHSFISGRKIDCLITGRYIVVDGKRKKSYELKKILRSIYFIPDFHRKKLKKITLENCLKSGTNIYFSPSCGTVIRKSAFDRIGGFDENIPYAHDFDFFLRFNAIFEVWETTEICAVYRMGANASLKGVVKYDFLNYFRGQFLEIMKKNNIALKYVDMNKDALIYTVYKQLGSGVDDELVKHGESVKKINVFRQLLYRVMTTMYFYNHNLDIQRLK